MPKFSFTIDVSASPDKVLEAMIDFSDKRPDIWPTLSKKLYKVYKVGDVTADVVEGTDIPGGSVWGREAYDWSQPGVVKSKLTDGNMFKPGGEFVMQIKPLDNGSHIIFSTNRRAKNIMAKMMGAYMQLSKGAPIRKGMLKVYGPVK